MRELDRKRYCQFYSRVEGRRCVYCGRAATETDHIPPINSLASRGSEYFHSNGIPLLSVPSCRVCNSLLGSLSLDTFEERQKYISDVGRWTGAKGVDQRDRHAMKQLEERVEKAKTAALIRKILKHLRSIHNPKDLRFWKAISGS